MGCGGSKKTSGSEPKKDEPKKEGVKPPKSSEEQIMEKFKEIDTDNTGYLTRDEIKKVLADLGEDGINDAEIDGFMDKVDKNDDGKVSYSEFYKGWCEASKSQKQGDVNKEKIIEAFKNIDKDGNGVLTKDEIKQAMKDINAYEGDEQVEKMIADADTDNDGKVNYYEFVEVLDKEKKE